MTKDSTLKIIIFSVMAFVVLWIIGSVLFPTGYGGSVSYNMPRFTSYGYNNFGITSLLTSIIQVLLVVFIITLILGAVSLIKNNLIKSEDVESLKGGTLNDVDQEGSEVIENPSETPETEPSTLEQPETLPDETNHTVKEKTTCPECGHELDPEWKICLNCGKELKKSRKRKNKNTED